MTAYHSAMLLLVVAGVGRVGDTARMSLDGLVEQTAHALRGARALFGAAPASGGWGSTSRLGVGRDGVAASVGVALQNFRGAGGSSYLATGTGAVAALVSVIGADEGTGRGLATGARQAREGRSGMTTVITDTRTGVAALAPTTDTPAGRQQLVAHLQSQLQRAKLLLRVSEQRNIMLATMIRNAAAGYRGGPMGGMGVPMMPAAGMASPLSLGGGAPSPPIAAIPGIGRRTGPHGLSPDPAHRAPRMAGGGPAAHVAVRAALSKVGRPYVWGAKGPDAFDCSGLVRWSWAQAGVTLGNDTYTQVGQGAPVAAGDVQAGDMIFPTSSFGEAGKSGPGHVMLAISPTEVVEAQQSGVPVKVSPMPSAFVARRPLAD